MGIHPDDKIYRSNVRDLNLKSKITSISCGLHFAYFLDVNGTVWGCGTPPNFELGNCQNQFTIFNNPNDFSRIPDLKNIKAVVAGWTHGLFITNDGKLYGLGSNRENQLTWCRQQDEKNELASIYIFQEPTLSEFKQKIVGGAAGTSASLVIDEFGMVWGCGNYKALGAPSDLQGVYRYDFLESLNLKAVSVACESSYRGEASAIITECGRLFIAGHNAMEKLGYKNLLMLTQMTEIIIPDQLIRSISIGEPSCVVVTDQGEAWKPLRGKRNRDDDSSLCWQPVEFHSVHKVESELQYVLSEENVIMAASGDGGCVYLSQYVTNFALELKLMSNENQLCNLAFKFY